MVSPIVEPPVCRVCGRELEATASTGDEPDVEIRMCADCAEGRSKVLVRMYDGTSRRYPQNKVFRGNYRLMMEGGKSYHTHVNCYLNWNRTTLLGFTGWKLIPRSSIGNIKKCPFCMAADGSQAGFVNMPIYEWEVYEGREPIGVMKLDCDDTHLFIGCLLVPGQTEKGAPEFFTGRSHIPIPEGVELIGFDEPYTIHFVTAIDEHPDHRTVSVSVYPVLFDGDGEYFENAR